MPTIAASTHSLVRRVTCALLLGAGASISGAVLATALQFDGSNDYVTFGQAAALGQSTFTVEAWIKRTGTGVATSTGTGGVSAIPLVTKGRSEADGTNQDMNWFLGIRGTDGVLVADFEEGAGGASPGLNHPIAGVTPISSGVWTHVAATYDGASWRLYVNGVQDATLAVNRPPRSDSIQHAAIGSALNSTGAAAGFFAGAVDEVRVWNTARTAAQLLASKDLEIASASGLVGRWGLNEGSGTVAASSAGGTLNGTLTNGPLWVMGFQSASQPQVVRGPYLQIGTPTSMIVRWRTDSATNSRVQFGPSAGSLTSTVDDAAVVTEHEVALTGLSPSSTYYYSVGTSGATLASGVDYFFHTNPPVGTAQPTRVWVLGDSGTKDATQASVRDGYLNFAAGRYTDVFLMLGDNAYETGTDAEYQAAVFDMYPVTLRQSPLWPTIGNHDTAQATNPPLTIPYFQMFTLPTNGAAGGAASGTEKYYSFDYGRIHFVCLDSMTSSRLPGSAMLTWLQNDLANTTQDWVVAFFHHPPYTKGSHNSDTETELTEMRQNVLPILEAGGVDLVLTGHSHSYERSFFIDGHYGVSSTFNAGMLENGGDGRENGNGVYTKLPDLAANDGAVYVVAGNGGHVTNWTGGSTAEFNPTPHPAMYYSALHVGSLALDIDGNRMDAKMIRPNGSVDDYFTIVKSAPVSPPAAPTGASATAGNAQVVLGWSASSGATGYSVKRSTVNGGPYTTIASGLGATGYTDNSVTNGVTYYYVVTASNTGGESPNSSQVSATPLPPAPPAPGGLSATAGNAQVGLAWNASAGATSYAVKRATVSGGPYATVASGIGGTSYSDTTVANGTTYYYVVTASNLGGESGNSNQANATPTAPTPPPAPTGLAASAGNAQVGLSWGASAGATSYAVKRATVSGGPYATVASGLGTTSYTDNSVTNGVTYYYVVTASNAGGESGNSNQASATPLPPAPAAPTGLAATAGNAQVGLGWNASSGATSYSVKRATTSGGPYSTIASGLGGTSYSDTSVTNGTTYYYVVSASNLGGQSGNSNQASATPTAPPATPAAPSNLTASAISRTRINLGWSDNANNETGFSIERSTKANNGFAPIASVGANATSYADTGVAANKTYYYRVRAVNGAGNSAYSNVASAKTPR